MDNILKQIISVDKNAKSTVNEAVKKRDNIEEKLSQYNESIKSRYKKETVSEIEKIKTEKQKELELFIARKNESVLAQKEKLQRTFEEKCDEWVKGMFDEIFE